MKLKYFLASKFLTLFIFLYGIYVFAMWPPRDPQPPPNTGNPTAPPTPPGSGGVGPGKPITGPIDNYLWLLIAAAIIVIMWVYYKKLKPQKI